MESLISALSAPSLFLPLSPHLHLSSFLPYFPFPFPFLSFICSFYILLFFLHLFFFLLLLLPLSTLIFSFVCFAHQHTSEKKIPPPLSLRHAHHVALPLGITARDLKVVPIHRELSVTEWAPFTSVMKISQETLWVATTFGDLCIFALLACFVFFSVKCPTTRLTHSVPPLLDDVAQRRQCTERMQIHTLCK